MSEPIKYKSMEDIHIDEIDQQIDIRKTIMAEMVGQLYPSIIYSEILRLQKRKNILGSRKDNNEQ